MIQGSYFYMSSRPSILVYKAGSKRHKNHFFKVEIVPLNTYTRRAPFITFFNAIKKK